MFTFELGIFKIKTLDLYSSKSPLLFLHSKVARNFFSSREASLIFKDLKGKTQNFFLYIHF